MKSLRILSSWTAIPVPEPTSERCNMLMWKTGFSKNNHLLHSLVAQTVKCLPAMWETWVRFLGREDPLGKEMAIHSSTLAWKIPWTEEPDRLQSMGSQKSWTPLSNFTHSLCSLKTLPLSVERSSLFLFSQKSGRFWWLP